MSPKILNEAMSRGSLMEISLRNFPESVSFRFFADFDIHVLPSATDGFTAQQQILLQAITNSSAVLRRIARMALETDLAGITGRHLGDLFRGPDNDEILQGVLSCLPDADRSYWESLRNGPSDALHQELMPVFLAFDVKLRRAGITELNSVLEPIRKTVGPTLDAQEL